MQALDGSNRLNSQVVNGANGAKASEDGWPAFHKSTVHTSPLTFDFDFDNVLDILVATYDGEILAFKDTVSLSTRCITACSLTSLVS